MEQILRQSLPGVQAEFCIRQSSNSIGINATPAANKSLRTGRTPLQGRKSSLAHHEPKSPTFAESSSHQYQAPMQMTESTRKHLELVERYKVMEAEQARQKAAAAAHGAGRVNFASRR